MIHDVYKSLIRTVKPLLVLRIEQSSLSLDHYLPRARTGQYATALLIYSDAAGWECSTEA